MDFHFAPVQGHTDAPYRHFHNSIYANGKATEYTLTYYTPFIRLEGGDLRKKDLKDFVSPLNEEAINIPQIIFRDKNELSSLVALMKMNGASHIKINTCCPIHLHQSDK